MLLRMLPRLARDRDPIHAVLHLIDSFRTGCARRSHRSCSACALRGPLVDKVTRLADLIASTHDSAVWTHRRCCCWNCFCRQKGSRSVRRTCANYGRNFFGGGAEGSVSIVLNGGYVDDSDSGDEIIYTGHGGNDSATGRQIADQQLKSGNLGLAVACTEGLPVRVTRGRKCDPRFRCDTGYRYDGPSVWRVIGEREGLMDSWSVNLNSSHCRICTSDWWWCLRRPIKPRLAPRPRGTRAHPQWCRRRFA